MHAGLRLSAVPLDLASVGSSEVFESKLSLSVPERCATTQTGEAADRIPAALLRAQPCTLLRRLGT
jgi:hypothetical protein